MKEFHAREGAKSPRHNGARGAETVEKLPLFNKKKFFDSPEVLINSVNDRIRNRSKLHTVRYSLHGMMDFFLLIRYNRAHQA